MSGVALHWFTSDLRIDDNPALAAGAEDGAILGVYVLDPGMLRRHADATRRLAFMAATLQALDARLHARGSRLVVLDGRAAEELPRLAGRVGARVVSGATNYEPGACTNAASRRRTSTPAPASATCTRRSRSRAPGS